MFTAVKAGHAAAGSAPAAAAPVIPEPPWCLDGHCAPDRADGSVFHMSVPQQVDTVGGQGIPDVCLTRIDDDGRPGQTTVLLSAGFDAGPELSPEQALALAEVLRDHAIRAAGAAGVEMSVERVRLGDDLLTPNGWQVVEIVNVDGWCCGIPPKPGHLCHVGINTDAHDDDEQAHSYVAGDLVRVRAVRS